MRRPIITVVNIVASVSLRGRIDLEKVTYMLQRTLYEPEQFPGLIYRMTEPKVVFLLFAGGKLVCTGAKSKEDVYAFVIKVRNQLERDALILLLCINTRALLAVSAMTGLKFCRISFTSQRSWFQSRLRKLRTLPFF